MLDSAVYEDEYGSLAHKRYSLAGRLPVGLQITMLKSRVRNELEIE